MNHVWTLFILNFGDPNNKCGTFIKCDKFNSLIFILMIVLVASRQIQSLTLNNLNVLFSTGQLYFVLLQNLNVKLGSCYTFTVYCYICFIFFGL